MRYKVKSQLYSDQEAMKQGILDDCGPSSVAAAVSWAAGYLADFSAPDGVAAKAKATGRVEKQGVSDNGSSLDELIKTARVLGAEARFAKSWDDAMTAAKAGAALGVWVQAPKGYPTHARSFWHKRWEKWWGPGGKGHAKDPKHFAAGYGHMTSAGWCADHGWQWADPTQDDRNPAEQYAFKVSEDELRAIASGKPGPDYKHLIIITANALRAKHAPATQQPVTPAAPTAVATQQPVKVAAPTAPVAQQPVTPAAPTAPATQSTAKATALVDQAAMMRVAEGLLGRLQQGGTTMNDLKAAAWDAIRAAISTSIAVFLGLGVSIFDLNGDGAKAIAASAIAAGLLVLQKWLDEDNTKYGLKR